MNIPTVLFCLDGRDNHTQKPSVLHRRFINRAAVCAGSLKSAQHLAPDFGMAHFATLELHHDPNLVPVSEKALRVSDLGLEVVRIDPAGKLNFLQFHRRLLLPRFLFALVALESELSVVHDLTHGRDSLSRHHDQIHTAVVSLFESARRTHDTKRFSGRTDQTDFLRSDLLIEQGLFFFRANGATPPCKK